jgi:hypothetical protein
MVLVFFAALGYAAGLAVFLAAGYFSAFYPNIFALLTSSWFLAGSIGMILSIGLLGILSAVTRPARY